jgi:hypothetical protein
MIRVDRVAGCHLRTIQASELNLKQSARLVRLARTTSARQAGLWKSSACQEPGGDSVARYCRQIRRHAANASAAGPSG